MLIEWVDNYCIMGVHEVISIDQSNRSSIKKE